MLQTPSPGPALANEQPDVNEQHERYLLELISNIEKEYRARVEPLINRLAAIRASRPMPPIYVEIDKLDDEMRKQLGIECHGK